MPRGSEVDKTFKALKKKGLPVGEAAAIAQKQTGRSLKSNKKLSSKKGKSK